MNYKENNIKNIMHGFFLAAAMTIAEPSTILPLIIHHFTANVVIIGIFVSLLRGGAILVQLVAAFYAQTFKKAMPYLRRVFIVRVVSWFLIGFSIFIAGDKNHILTLILFGVFLFIFSFSAGFGSIYFSEVIAKVFDKQERGKTMANRQLFAAVGSILSGGVAGWVLSSFEPPRSYAYLFMISAFLMSIGMFAFASIKEPVKKNVRVKEESFLKYIKNAFFFLKEDKALQIQILSMFFSYSFLFAFPFVIIQAKNTIHLTGWLVGGFVTVQMLGSILGNIIWKKLSPDYKKIFLISYGLVIVSFLMVLLLQKEFVYFAFFFLMGMAIDGFRISGMNLLFEIAPEDKRPIYVALQNNITSIGLFFSIPGGFILEIFSYKVLYIFTVFMLFIGIYFASKLRN